MMDFIILLSDVLKKQNSPATDLQGLIFYSQNLVETGMDKNSSIIKNNIASFLFD